MGKKIVSALIFCTIIGGLFAGCQGKTPKLTVAMELAYPPFEMKDDAGNPVGISVDFARDLGAYLGRDVEIVDTAWDGLIPTLQTGKADLVISSMTITEGRKEVVDFSIPYANAMHAFLAKKRYWYYKFRYLE